VSPEVASVLMSKEIELGGEEREVTVLFSDVCDFATLCEGGSPSVILDRLNRYLSVMSRVIEAENGIVDKYAGDAVMALFGAPIAHVDDGARAVRAALEMQRALQPLNEILLAEGAADLRIGVGINTAVVVAGNMGSPSRLNYTVIGDGVNLAARIEGLTKVYGVGVLVSAATRDAAPDFVYREVDRVKVKGKRELVTIYEPLGPPAEVGAPARAQVDAHHRALEAYRRQDWNAAHEGFTALQKIADAPLTALFLERIDELRHHCQIEQARHPAARAENIDRSFQVGRGRLGRNVHFLHRTESREE
jgi:adenylate cyclase